MRRLGGLGAALLCAPLALTGALTGTLGPAATAAAGTSWAPAARDIGGLRVLAESDADGFRLHTVSGDKTFLPGVNLGSTTPLHQPGEVGGIPRGQYAAWLDQMGDLGIRVVRVYTLLPPGFYAELAARNRAHPDAPIYLVQGAYLPDESYVEGDGTLYDPPVDEAFTRELEDISDAVHGDLVRERAPGRAGGTYDTDISAWVAGWVIGVEWDQFGTQRTDEQHADAAYEPGRWFAATQDATATERWIARHLDALAGHEAARGTSAPIAMANWPTTDPLAHPQEPNATEDLVSIDANHVLPTHAWPGGTFASFHLYPYYPDFQRYETTLERWGGRRDPYAGYVAAVRDHFAGTMPLLVTEFGVPASLGKAHTGPLGRDQGGHTEQEAMTVVADLMRMLESLGTGGGFVFSWEDEWFKRTWNTADHQDPERRQLWHDPLTNEQWFGLMATDPDPIPDAAAELIPRRGAYRYVLAWADASWVHLDVTLRRRLPDRLELGADVVPELAGDDYRVRVDRRAGTARVTVRRELDPIRLDSTADPYRPGADKAWHPYALLTNRAREVDGVPHPAEYDPVGRLVRGTWDPASPRYDSTATWQVDGARHTVRLRLPWSMLGLADPSGRTALGPGIPAALVRIQGIGLTFTADRGTPARLDFTWPTWNHTTYTQRPKAGLDLVEDAFRDLAP